MKEQKVMNDIREVEDWLQKRSKIMLVCGSSLNHLEINSLFLSNEDRIVRFRDFKPNPDVSSVENGKFIFDSDECDSIVAIGGGSAIDVAKCIRKNSLDRRGDIPFLAIPTTAGSGSEATKFAVIYRQGVKQSIEDENLRPDYVFFDSSVLRTLQLYQKKSTMLDALSHAIESWWSVNSTLDSEKYSKESIQVILKYKDDYINGIDAGYKNMLLASYIAGKAINITRTTAGHAMCYKITGLFGISHGHAACMCNRILFEDMESQICSGKAVCRDKRGVDSVLHRLTGIAEAMGCNTAEEGAKKLLSIFDELGMEVPSASEEEIELLTESVNEERLNNHPIVLDKESIRQLYRSILRSRNAG